VLEPQLSLRRLALALAIGVAALVEIHAFVQNLQAQARERERVVRDERRAIQSAAPLLARALESPDPAVLHETLREIIGLCQAAEIEIRGADGRPLLALPGPPPVEHWPTARELDGLMGGGVLTVGPVGGAAGRVFTYMSIRTGSETRTLRIAKEAGELVERLRDGQRLMMTHGAALVVLVLALALLLLRERSRLASPPPALRAYEEAMDRLRERGQELTRRHEAERRVLEAHIEDQDALARAGELTAGIVHEVRNGLATILGHARLLEAVPAASESARAVREECETLETVIRRFMEFVRREELQRAPLDLGRLLGRVIARESRSRPGAEVRLVAGTGTGGPFLGDEELLERAFENLVRNAREAAGASGRVGVTLEEVGGGRLVRVSDDGPGLPDEVRAGHRPFLTTKPGGLGLGLAIALKVVRLHGGSLVLADNRPRGVVATVTLPAASFPVDRVVTQGSGTRASAAEEVRPDSRVTD
jgi:signal transduction histidine kinase